MKKLFTIGFTQKSAQEFFQLLQKNQVDILADLRLNNTNQLAGFAKKRDLEYFLSLFGIKYEHWTLFAPTKELRDKYRAEKDWASYVHFYTSLIEERGILKTLDHSLFESNKICLLCSEAKPEKCHRRIAAEMIAKELGHMKIIHL